MSSTNLLLLLEIAWRGLFNNYCNHSLRAVVLALPPLGLCAMVYLISASSYVHDRVYCSATGVSAEKAYKTALQSVVNISGRLPVVVAE